MAPSKRKGPTPRKSTPTNTPPAARRYTPPRLVKRIRPGWHIAVGSVQVLVGVALVIVNYGEEFGLRVLPGGHQEAYFLLGILVAGSSIWWFGWFDRPTPLNDGD